MVLLVVLLASAALAAVSPQDFVERTQARFDTVRAASGTARDRLCHALVAELFDGATIARATAAAEWAGLSTQHRAALGAAVRRRLDGNCAEIAARPKTGDGVVRRVREIEGGIRLTVQFPDANGDGSVFVWTLRPGGSFGWTARDLVIDGRGVMATLRADFEAALAARGGNVGAAISDLARVRAP